MTYSVDWPKRDVTRLLRFSVLLLGIGLLWATTTWASQIVVPGLPFEKASEAWIEGELLLLKTEDGRLYSVPVGSVELESIPVDGAGRTHTGPTVSDIIELLLAGVSEPTIKAYIESTGARFEISTEDILSLKRAGASEAFIQYMIFRGRAGRITNYFTWRGPSAPRREVPPATEVRETGAQEYQSGIPYFPYVFPGFGAYYPIYPSHPIYPGHPSRLTKPGRTGRDKANYDLLPGARPGYYWPVTRSLMKPSETRPNHRAGRPAPEPYRRGKSGTGGLWLRWKGGSNPNRNSSAAASHSGSGSYASPNTRGAPSSGRAHAPLGPARSTMSTGSSGRPSGGRSLMGSGSAARSSGRTRSLIKK